MRATARFLPILAALAALITSPARATLVVIMPAADGVVVAADTRLTLRGRYLDGIDKVHFVRDRPELAFALTGQSEFYPLVPDDATDRELLHVLQNGPRQYSARAVVTDFLSKQPPGSVLNQEMLKSLGKRLTITLTDAMRSRMNGRPFFGKQLFRTVVVQHDALRRTSRIGSLRMDLSRIGHPRVEDVQLRTIEKEDSRIALIYGELQYFMEHVQEGAGFKYIPRDVIRSWGQAGRVGEMKVSDALAIASGWIRATAKTSEIIPIKNGVGGAPKVYLLDGMQPARELRDE